MSGQKKYSAKKLCEMYPQKYIAVNHIYKNKDNLIVSAEVLKVYDTLDDCKKNSSEIKFFMMLYKDDFDIVYGDFEDYKSTRAINEEEIVIDAFQMLGSIAFEMFFPNYVDNILEAFENSVKERE